MSVIFDFPPRVEYRRNVPRKDYFHIPAEGTYGRIRHVRDFPAQTVPSVYQGGLWVYQERKYSYEPLPPSWQWYIWRGLEWACDGLLPKGGIYGYYRDGVNTFALTYGLTYVYVNLIERHRAFTDSASPEVGFYDAVTGRNEGAMPYEWLMRTCTGNLVKVKRDWGKYWVVEALDILQSPPSDFRPHLIHWATELRPDGVVSWFPQMEIACKQAGYNVTGTPIPFLSLGGEVSIPKEHIEILSPGSGFSPYMR